MKTSKLMTSNKISMDSLALPQDLYWENKMERASLSTGELFSFTEPMVHNWLNNDDNITDNFNSDDSLEFKEEIYCELVDFDNVIDNFKEEICKETKGIEPEQFNTNDFVNSNSSRSLKSFQNAVIANTSEISTFNSDVLTQLTPPHSPPQFIAPSNVSANQSINVPAIGSIQPLPFVQTYENNCVDSGVFLYENSNDEIKRHAQVVDEILKTRVDELYNNDNVNVSYINDCSWSSGSSDSFIPSKSDSPTTSCASQEIDFIDDDDADDADDDAVDEEISSKLVTKKRTRTYGRGFEERKIRKKEQNKNAATRYRQKKKLEMESVLNEESILISRNEDLKRTYLDLKRKAKYLKDLVREFYGKKGIN